MTNKPIALELRLRLQKKKSQIQANEGGTHTPAATAAAAATTSPLSVSSAVDTILSVASTPIVIDTVDLLCSLACKFGMKHVEKKTNQYRALDDVYVQARKDLDTLQIDRAAGVAHLGSHPLISDRDRTIGSAIVLTRRPDFAKPTHQSSLADIANAIYVSYSPVERDDKKGLLTQVITKGGSTAMRPKQRFVQEASSANGWEVKPGAKQCTASCSWHLQEGDALQCPFAPCLTCCSRDAIVFLP